MNGTRFGLRASAALLLAGTTLGGVAQAQTTTPPDSSAQEAQRPDESTGVADIVVTAQKRAESLQQVPLSITALSTAKLEQLQVRDFFDYAKYLPSLSYQTVAPGFSNVYFRGVASGENANHSAQLPSVGTYLDEQPITTIQGALDIHVYDIARVEALSGPQGTLYGASSEAGTIRIITNKPDPTAFSGEVRGEVNTVAHGDRGYVGEGFVNLPISSAAALRVVGWYDKQGGYIDNIPGTRVFPTLGPDGTDVPGTNTVTNAAFVEKNYNDVETYGGRAALLIDLDDNWTVTPQLMGQVEKTHGSFAEELGAGARNTVQYNPEGSLDKWYQAALTITGKIGSFDVTYAGNYLKRHDHTDSDYSDYAFYYDALFGYGAYYVDGAGNPISNQRVHGVDRYTKQSHELRVSWEQGPAHFVGGLFYQRQQHVIEQNYVIDGLDDGLSFAAAGTNAAGVPYVNVGKGDNIWLTQQKRIDRDYAAFGELTVHVTPRLDATLGGRVFKYDNSLVGFFGYAIGFSSGTGEGGCFAPTIVKGSPCTNLDKRVKDTDFTHKINLTYHLDRDKLIYATTSRGYRPGGINRRGTLPPYQADFIDNYEIGWKTSFAGSRIRWNGAGYHLYWSDIQFSYLGANGLTEIRNAGNANIWGVESELTVAPVQGLGITLSGAYTDAKLANNYCRIADPTFRCLDNGNGNSVQAPKGTRLPITPKFKGNVQARYDWTFGSDWHAHVQGTAAYQTRTLYDLRTDARAIFGPQKGYGQADFALGGEKGGLSLELYVHNAFDVLGGQYRSAQCSVFTCGGTLYNYIVKPRTIGLRLGEKF